MVRRLSIGKNNRLTCYSLAIDPRRDHSHMAMSQRSHSDRGDDLSIIVDKHDFEGDSRAGSPRKASSKPLKKQSLDRGTSDSE